jgi:hypothetical protein
MTIVPQGSGDKQATWNTNSAINSGSLTANGHYGGSIVAAGLTAFAINVTAISSGTENYFFACGPVPSSTVTTSSSGTQTVTGTVTANQGTANSAANAWPVQETVSGANIDPRVISFTAPQHVIIDSATLPTIILGAGSAIIGKVTTDQTTPGTTDLVHAAQQGTWTVQPGNTQNTTPWLVGGGITITQLTSASATACTSIRASAGRIWSITNSGPATTVFPSFHNDAGTACASGTAFLGDFTSITLGPGAIYPWTGGMAVAGVAYKLSGALTAGQNITIITGPL